MNSVERIQTLIHRIPHEAPEVRLDITKEKGGKCSHGRFSGVLQPMSVTCGVCRLWSPCLPRPHPSTMTR